MWRIPKPRHRNFYVENGVAYTEDVKEVRRVEVLANLPISKQSLVEHFSSFGSVEMVQWDEEKLRGSVLFEEATQAAKALYCVVHKYNGCELCLRASDTGDQPPDKEEPGRQSADCLPIVDDAWGLVLDYLPLNARLNFASSCQRFQTIYQLESQHMSRVLNIKQVCMLTAWNIKELMRLSGEHIQRLEGGPLHPCWPHFNQFVQLLGSSCPNLTELSFHGISLTPYHMQNLFESPNGLHKVTSLALRRCDLSDRDLLYLQPLTQLRTLDLRENHGLWGSTLGNLPDSVETLNLSGCENLEPTLLSNLEALPLLRELRCPQIRLRNFNHDWLDIHEFQVENLATDEHVYRELVQSCPLLEVLDVTVCPYMDEPQLGGLSHLRTLVLRAIPLEPPPYQVNNSLLLALVEMDSLRHLEFREGGPGFVDAVGLKIISQLKEIRSLVLRNQDFEAHELRQLRKLNALELLDLSDSPHLSNEIAIQLAKTLSGLRQLKVERCPLISRRLIEILKDRTMLQVDI
ncbi:uncharacterized protein LOC108135072 [Drosophila elegans]|uniref:uncharacterized protein LOC108135072 n=1 Tax=Drosophila elegans TaxID=30023 RepID=UPI0007E60C88|nr:uncharacterized protein LOC108135072 [Drosophila elegans]